jgi:hypothetical protein
MATILKFKIPTARNVSRFGAGHSAEIVLFTGVRYERWVEAKAAPVKAKRKRRSRAKVNAVAIAL